MKPNSAISRLMQYLLVFGMILATQGTTQVSAQQILGQPGTSSQFSPSGGQKSSAAVTGCQWTYYPITAGKLQPEQPLFNDPDNTPINNLSLGILFKGNPPS